MREKVYVDRLFADYEDIPEITDFKEEITANLSERVKELVSSGISEDKAFEKATAELGDISAIADSVGRKKRNEAFCQMYIGTKVPFSKKTVFGITAATGLLLLAAGLALIMFFSDAPGGVSYYYLAAILLSASCALYTYFGLTQETTAHYPMKNGRALAYAAVCLSAVLAAGLAVVAFLFNDLGIAAALGMKIALILPAICALIVLLGTEPKRQKPWLKALIDKETENAIKLNISRPVVDPLKAVKFGIASGGMWICAAALFLSLGFLVSWLYSWLVFPFAAAVQVFMVMMIFRDSREN